MKNNLFYVDNDRHHLSAVARPIRCAQEGGAIFLLPCVNVYSYSFRAEGDPEQLARLTVFLLVSHEYFVSLRPIQPCQYFIC